MTNEDNLYVKSKYAVELAVARYSNKYRVRFVGQSWFFHHCGYRRLKYTIERPVSECECHSKYKWVQTLYLCACESCNMKWMSFGDEW